MEIMDHKQKGELSADHHHQEMASNQKGCVDCKATKTPLWRSGPAGPKSLCNACGIRYRKKSKSMLGLNRGLVKKKQKSTSAAAATTDESQNSSNSKKGGGEISTGKEKRVVSKDLRVRLMALGKEFVLLQRQRSSLKRRQRSIHSHHNSNLGEVEQAAVLLMALSCGSVFA